MPHLSSRAKPPRWLVLVLFAVSCANTAHVRPTAKGHWDGDFNLGGPVAEVPGVAVIPLPLTSVGASYGIADNLDLQAHVHLTSLVLGVAAVDVGSTWMFVKQAGAVPAVSVGARLFGFKSLRAPGADADLELDASASWVYARRWMSYVQGGAYVQFLGGPVLPLIAVGESLRVGRTELLLEGRWYAFNEDARYHILPWTSIGNQGALGLLFGVRYHFGDQS